MFIDKKTQDTCYGVENVNTHLILLASDEGAVIELQEPFTPECKKDAQRVSQLCIHRAQRARFHGEQY